MRPFLSICLSGLDQKDWAVIHILKRIRVRCEKSNFSVCYLSIMYANLKVGSLLTLSCIFAIRTQFDHCSNWKRAPIKDLNVKTILESRSTGLPIDNFSQRKFCHNNMTTITDLLIST